MLTSRPSGETAFIGTDSEPRVVNERVVLFVLFENRIGGMLVRWLPTCPQRQE